MKQIIEILKAVGEDTRLRIIALLTQGELVVQEIVNVLSLSQPRISRHIKLLAESGVIIKRSEGAWVFVKLTNDEKVRSVIAPIISAIESQNPIIAKDIIKLGEIRKARQARAQNYFDAIAPEWESLRKLQQPEQEVEATLKSMVKNKNFKFHIDFGSGTGSILEAFAQNTEAAEGIDNSKTMLALARSRLNEVKNGAISVRLGDILDAPYEDNVADFITINQVLHYLDNPQLAINEAARVLKSGGIMLLADFAQHEFEELRRQHGHIRLGFSMAELEDMCKLAGFEIIETKTIGASKNKKNAQLSVNILKLRMRQKPIKTDAPIKNNSEAV